MSLQEEIEMTDSEILRVYGDLINEAAIAMSLDANYAADIVKKAKSIQARSAK